MHSRFHSPPKFRSVDQWKQVISVAGVCRVCEFTPYPGGGSIDLQSLHVGASRARRPDKPDERCLRSDHEGRGASSSRYTERAHASDPALKHYEQHALLFISEYHMVIQPEHHKAAVLSNTQITKLVH